MQIGWIDEIHRNLRISVWLLLGFLLLSSRAYAVPYNYTDTPAGGIFFDSGTNSCAGTPLTRTINVSDSFLIDDLDFGFIADHTYRGDVEVTVTSPNATSVTVINGVGGALDNLNVQLNDGGASLNDGLNHNTGVAPYQYNRGPSAVLSTFIGEQANGNWTVEICDNAGGDSGTYYLSELIFQGTPGSGSGFPSGVLNPASGTVVNSYAAVSSISGSNVNVSSTTGFTAGGRAIIVQMQGATVDRTDTSTHGDISSYGTAGRFEYVEIQSVGGGVITLTAAPTITFDTSGAVQIVSVPIYGDQTLSGTISAPAWNGSTGGVVAIDSTGELTLSGDIDVTGLGFAGGALATTTPYDSCASDQSNYTSAVTAGTGNKGGGITLDSISHAARRGHNANGGGGGNITDAGGGGGGNVGAGGVGGRELDLCDGTPPSTHNTGGLGGQALDYSPANRLFMGGGGGSGSEVSQAATGGDRSGGGMIFLRADTIVNTSGRLLTIGLSSMPDDVNGADGGAAGGSVAISVHNGITGLPTVSVAGGDGGDEANGSYAHGTGGGGGGGAIRLNGAVCSDLNYQVDGGEAGTSVLGNSVGDPNWGAEPGDPGDCAGSYTSLPLVPLPGGSTDYSDAPISGTSYGDATHTIVSGIQLGANIDADAGSLASANADGDDTDGTDDEDGISSLPALTETNTTYTVPIANISAQGSGTIHGWIDVDGSGSFDADEYASSTVTSGAVQSDLNWSFSDLMSAGTTFARFRLTSDGSINANTPSGLATDGEVEDYPLTVSAYTLTPPTCGVDPATNQISNGDFAIGTGPSWTNWTAGGNWFGTGSASISVDTGTEDLRQTGLTGLDNGPAASGAAIIHVNHWWRNGNPAAGSNSATMDVYVGGTQYARVTTPDDGPASASVSYFNGAIGNRTSFDEFATQGWEIELPSTVSASGDFAFRFTGTVSGWADDFTLDDIAVYTCPEQRDYSDAPTSGTSYGDTGHTIVSGIHLGATVDSDAGSLASANADGDDADGADDEDGVTIPSLTQGLSANISVDVTQTSANSGYLQAWVDWNGNGSFGDAGEQVATDLQSGSSPTGTITVPVNVPAAATTSQTFARFRWSTTSGLDSTTTATDGEVEDYALTINAASTAVCPADFTLTSSTGYADAVIVAANNSTLALGAPEAPGTAATNSNSARTTQTLPILTLDLTDRLPENGVISLTIAKNNAAADYSIETSLDDITYTPVATYNTGTEDVLQITNVTVPAGGARYIRFVRTAGSLWVGGLEYSEICVGTAKLDGSKSVAVWDPGATGLYAVPGNDVIYTIQITNTGEGAADDNSIVLIDPIPGDVEFYHDDIDDGGPETDPVSFAQTGAGLTFTYATDVAYSNGGSAPADFASCTYSPATGYDPNVTYICVNPKGSMAAGDPDPDFEVSFRARIK